jgi:hypothetical protein
VGLDSEDKNLYNKGRPLGVLIQAKLVVEAARPALKLRLGTSAETIACWKELIPSRHHVPTPLLLWLAMVALACAWGWVPMVAMLLILFPGGLRPVDGYRMRWKHVRGPSAHLGLLCALFLIIEQPKMRRLAARREHARIDDPDVIDTLEALAAANEPDSLVWPSSAARFRTTAWSPSSTSPPQTARASFRPRIARASPRTFSASPKTRSSSAGG